MAGGNFDARSFVSKPKRTGQEHVDEQAFLAFKNLIKILDLCQQRPDIIPAMVNYGESRVMGHKMGLSTAGGKGEDTFNPTYVKIGKLPKYWRAEFLTKHMSGVGLSPDVIEKVDKKSAAGVNQIFEYVTALPDSSSLPREMLSKEVCDSALASRVKALGRATAEFVGKAISQDGSLNWRDSGCYEIRKDGDELVVAHVSGSQVLGANQKIWQPSMPKFSHGV